MKRYIYTGAVISMSALLAACGGNSEETGGSNSDDVVELSFWASANPDRDDFKLTMDRVEQFNEEHDDIQLNIETTPHADYRTRLNTQAAGGQLPDIFQVWPGTELQPLVDGGAVGSINNILDNWTDNGLLNEDAIADFSFDGETYAIPSVQNPTSFVYYNVDMLNDLGYEEFPQTYDEFKELIEDLKAEDTTPIALGNSASWVLQSVYISTIADRFTGNDFIAQVLEGERAFTDDDFVEALGVIDELVDIGAFNEDLNTIDDNQMIEYFLQERSAMVIDGNWGAISILTNKPDDMNVGIAPFPLGDTGTISTVYGNAWSLNADLEGEKREAGETFLKWMFNEDFYQELIGVNRVVAADVEMPSDADLEPLFLDMLELSQQAPPAPVYDAVLPQAVNNVLQNELQAITIGRSTPEEAAQNIQNAVNTQ
ncbi:extracellular solute-binding protein [Alkalicoccobacillus murimartini]|uniref:Raffinose/stachyose/melibiose transport system substrate-binding protein n=1 Tax=Alkalicoccobacillus murimartini TaxID=171685 RepID=A0ABT9YGG3_9BACI|nr:extracellular solute-binding protein [Alkalicoccobacillus murimartini]MDQ0206958.1 raffinose/stachyose/melibiose transport system substrate-binding protein [Alkalicoccobacillus murimartini]